MTDVEIVKALECCTSDEVGMCHICPLDGGCNGDITILLNCSLDLINRQKAEIERMKKNTPRFILTGDESFASLTQKLPKLNPLVMSSDNASIVCIDADKIKAEAIKECLNKVAVFCAESGLFHCEADEMLLFNYLDLLKMQAMLEANGMAGDTE